MKKIILIILALICLTSCSSMLIPYEPSNVILSSGDTISNVLTKTDKNILKYKTYSHSETKQINLSEVAFVELYGSNENKKVEYFEVIGQDRYVGVEKVMQGKNIEVYSIDYTYTNTLAGGMTMSGVATNYYVKTNNENRVTFIGNYDAIRGQFKIRVHDYFSDCPKLIKKLNEKEIRLRDGFMNIAEFYINNCE